MDETIRLDTYTLHEQVSLPVDSERMARQVRTKDSHQRLARNVFPAASGHVRCAYPCCFGGDEHRKRKRCPKTVHDTRYRLGTPNMDAKADEQKMAFYFSHATVEPRGLAQWGHARN